MARIGASRSAEGGIAGALGPTWLKEHVVAATVVLTAVGYGLVAATFQGLLPFYPNIGEAGVDALGHAIAVVNAAATICLVAGWYWIRNGEVRKHARAMTTAFALILGFLLLYLPKVGGGGEKHLPDAVPFAISLSYFVMLAIHILLSALAMPVVVYAFLLGVTHGADELRETNHARIGRIAAGSWVLSLVLGVVTDVVLNHVYEPNFVPA